MSKDISTPYTKEQNKKCGRTGYCGFKREKETEISPSAYGMFFCKRLGGESGMNKPRILYAERSVETEPLSRKILVHAAMHYKCEVCGTIFQFWLEKGLEDRRQDKINPQNHKPVPFCIACLCGGIARHFAWGSDIRLDDYRLLKEDENYFENTEDGDCGVSHFRNRGNARVIRPELKELADIFAEEAKNRSKEQFASEPTEDDPYGLAYISTTALKAELRRRKRWR